MPSETRLKDDYGRLDASAIEVKRIPGFSTNKIPNSQKGDLCFQFNDEFKKTYTADWKPGQKGLKPKKKHYTVNKSLNFFFIPIEGIHNFTGSIPYTNNKNNYSVMKYTVYVMHKPLIANYWHFELYSEDENNDPIKWTSKIKKAICSDIRDRILTVAEFSYN